ncbi:peptide deformylase [bacterium]|nr:peptide deformylase [bacterium]
MLAKKNIILELSGLPAVCFQHEIEHLDGILFYDHIKKEKTFLNNENLIMI